MSSRLRTIGLLAALPLLVLAACGSNGATADPTDPAEDESVAPDESETDGGDRPDPDGTDARDGTDASGAPGAGDEAPVGQPQPVALADATDLDAHLAAVADLAVGIVANSDEDTLVVSPASLATALVMLGAGADGQTLEEIEHLLGADVDGLLESIQALRAHLADLDEDPADIELDPLPPNAIVHMANQVVLQDGVTAERDWLDIVTYRLGTQVVETPVADMQQVLDEWVALHTAGLIESSAIQADSDVELVVQDATLVASAWLSGFSPELTTDDDFTLPDGDVVRVPTMHSEHAMPYTEVDGHRAVQLQLLDGLALQVVLPADGAAPGELDAQDWAALSDGLDADHQVLVDLALPRADISSRTELAPALAPLGVVELFGPRPGLTGILADGPHTVDQAVQQARLQIGEEGVVAAAVTEMAMVTSAVVPPPDTAQVVVDRPYAVRVVDSDSGWVLFHAVVGDPRGE